MWTSDGIASGRANRIGDSAEIALSSYADGVVLIGQVATVDAVVVERPNHPGHSRIVLQTAVVHSGDGIAGQLGDSDPPLAGESRAAGHHRQRYRTVAHQSRFNVH